MMPGVLSRYIARRFTGTLLLILLAIGFIVFVADYVEVLRRFSGKDGFTSLLGLQLAAMRVPILLDTALPFTFLFAAIISLLALSRKLELVVARASGVSVWGFMRAPFVVAIIFGILATAFLNPLAVDLKEKAENLEAELTGRSSWGEGYWFRQDDDVGRYIVHAGSADDDGLALFGVTAFVFGPDAALQEKVTAPRAKFGRGGWVLEEATVASAAQAPYQADSYILATELTASELRRSFTPPEAVSIWSLPGYIAMARSTGIDPDRFRVALHILINRPLFFVAMVMIAATVGLRLTRYGGNWRFILTGAALGFLLYAASEIVRDLGGNGIIDPVLAAWLPPIVALTFGATALLYQEDG